MKLLAPTLIMASFAGAMALSLSAFAATPGPMMSAPGWGTTSTAATSSGSLSHYVASNVKAGDNWFGGPIYHGKPSLAATAALVKAGGGAAHFKFSTALVSMLGPKTVHAEVAKLTRQYGKKKVHGFITGMTFAVDDALKRATQQGIQLPPPANLHGTALAKALVKAGTAPGGTFWAGYLFDRTISHSLHNQVMGDIDARESMAADGNVHRILNQAMFDVAQALGMKHVKLAPFH